MSFIWLTIIILYLGVLEIIAVILAVKTRNIKIKAVNDSKDVIDIVYIVAIASFCMLVLSYVLQDYSNIGIGLVTISMLLAATGTITLTFVPKVKMFSLRMFDCLMHMYRCGLCTKTQMVRMYLKRILVFQDLLTNKVVPMTNQLVIHKK